MSVGINSPGNQNTPIADAGTIAQTATAETGVVGQDANLTTGKAAETGNFAGVAQALGMVPPQKSDTDLMALLQSMRMKVDNTQLKSSEQDIQNTKVAKKQAAETRIAKLREAAKGPPSWVKGLKKFGEISSYIGAAVLIVAGAACAPMGFGVFMMMAGVAMMSMAIAQSTAKDGEAGFMQDGMDGAIGGIAKGFENMGMGPEAAHICAAVTVAVAVSAAMLASAPFAGPGILVTVPMVLPMVSGMVFTPENLQDMGADDKAAMIASITISATVAITTAVASLGAGIALTVATGGAAAAPIAANTATTIGLTVAGIIAQLSGAAVSASTQVLGGAASVGEGVHNQETMNAQADANDMKAMMTKLLAQLQAESERIAEIMKRVEEGADVVMNVMTGEGKTMDRAMQALGASRSMA